MQKNWMNFITVVAIGLFTSQLNAQVTSNLVNKSKPALEKISKEIAGSYFLYNTQERATAVKVNTVTINSDLTVAMEVVAKNSSTEQIYAIACTLTKTSYLKKPNTPPSYATQAVFILCPLGRTAVIDL
jgi:hypothetical protein